MKLVIEARKALARKRQKGLTLIEAAMVLGVAALVIAGVLVLYNTANSSNKTSEALNQLNIIQNAVRNVYGGTAGFSGLSQGTLIDAKALPQKMVNAAGDGLKNSFNGDITIAGTADDFTVTFAGIPADACITLSTKDYGRSLGSLTAGTAAYAAGTIPTPALAKDACASSSSNTMAWKFLN